MIVLVTDFGPSGPYSGQVKAVLDREAPGVAVIDLCADAPAFDPQSAAYLLSAWATAFPAGAIFIAVVDPGVGGARAALAVEAEERWYLGPDNGILAMVIRRAKAARIWEITWRPEQLSATFHGRDLFAPVAGRLARGEAPPGRLRSRGPDPAAPGADWPDDLARILYIDHFGNAVTGLRVRVLGPEARLTVAGHRLDRARRFRDLPPGTPFWYENANGLAEIAVNRGHAARDLGLSLGMEVAVGSP